MRLLSILVWVIFVGLAALSLLAIAAAPLHFAWAPVLQSLVEDIDHGMQYWLTPVEAIVNKQLAKASYQTLWPEWRHVLALLCLYLFASAHTYWGEGRILSIFAFVWGLMVALAASLAVGMAGDGDQAGTFLLIAVPLAYLAYRLGITVWRVLFSDGRNEFARFLRLDLPIALVALVAFIGKAAVQTSFGLANGEASIFLLFALIVLLALYQIWRGVLHVRRHGDGFDGLLRLGNVWTGLVMLGSVGVATFAVIAGSLLQSLA